ncbi:hypothetical protein Tco_0723329 [Tanacetum coccineum]
MQQFWLTIKKTKKTPLYEFGLAEKMFSIDVELFRKILDICPRVLNEDFVAPPSEEDLLAFLIELGYKVPEAEGIQTLTAEEQLADETMQALKACKNSSRIQSHTGGSSEGTSIIPGVPDESIVIVATSSEGIDTIPWVPDEVKDSSEAKEEEKQDDQDDDVDRSIDIEKTDDEEETDGEFVHGDEYVHGNVVKEMKDVEVAETGKDDEEITDAKKTDAKKTEVTKGDLEQAGKLPLTSSSLSVSSGFGNLFLNLSSDTSLIGTTKESVDT